jgi:hypothetical protein
VSIAAHGDRIILNTNPDGNEAIYRSYLPMLGLGPKHVTIESGTFAFPFRFVFIENVHMKPQDNLTKQWLILFQYKDPGQSVSNCSHLNRGYL